MRDESRLTAEKPAVHRGEDISKDQIMKAVWPDTVGENRSTMKDLDRGISVAPMMDYTDRRGFADLSTTYASPKRRVTGLSQ
jgi:hypothetical protein